MWIERIWLGIDSTVSVIINKVFWLVFLLLWKNWYGPRKCITFIYSIEAHLFRSAIVNSMFCLSICHKPISLYSWISTRVKWLVLSICILLYVIYSVFYVDLLQTYDEEEQSWEHLEKQHENIGTATVNGSWIHEISY